METQTCRTCKESFPLTNEFWGFDKRNENGFAIKCKVCVAEYYRNRYASIKLAEKHRRERNRDDGGFEAQALSEHIERIKNQCRPMISIYQEIAPPPKPQEQE